MKEVLLRGDNIEKVFRQGGTENPVLHDLSVEIYKGDFTVIMGASGAGKSTLLYGLSCLDRISGGSVHYKGSEISSYSEDKLAELRAKEFGFVFQQTHLVSNLTLFENVALAGYVSRKATPKEMEQRADQLLTQMGVQGARYRFPSETSGGEAQRAAIARAMISSPSILFADEPTGALNKSSSTEVLNLLTGLNRSGQTILMVTHDIRAAVRGSRILYLEDGKLLDELSLGSWAADRQQEEGRRERAAAWLSSLRW